MVNLLKLPAYVSPDQMGVFRSNYGFLDSISIGVDRFEILRQFLLDKTAYSTSQKSCLIDFTTQSITMPRGATPGEKFASYPSYATLILAACQ